MFCSGVDESVARKGLVYPRMTISRTIWTFCFRYSVVNFKMESTRGYAEPELQKMAVFLKERCDRGQYGLTYYNAQKTMIRIPWPTVPRQNEDVSENFGMFTEWAYLSFRKRGNRGEQLENEALSAQKHRFRNALARADGLRQCKDLSTETIRVYEFVDTKKDRDQSENGIQRHSRNSPSNLYEQERMDLPQYPIHAGDYSDSSQTLEYPDCWGSPMTITSSPNHTPGYHNTGVFQVPPEATAMQEDRQPSLGTLLEEMINTPEPTLPYAQTNDGFNATYAVPQPVQIGVSVSQPVHNNYRMTNELQVPPEYAPTNQANGVLPHIAHMNHHLLVKVYFRGEEVMQRPVTNPFGFRLYSGNNIPDMRRLLAERQQNQLKAMSKYHSDYLFGPENLDQVEMPAPRGPVPVNGTRTLQIIDNMDRGILFFLDDRADENMQYNEPTMPNVFAVRLCQTRVFPSETNVQNREQLEENGIKRLEWVQIFDGSEFTRQMNRWITHCGPTPSSIINLSVGQKPKRDKTEHNLVSVTISVTKAKLLVEKYFEDQMEEIFISEKTSMDKAAKQHEDEVRSRIQIDDTAVY